MKAKYLNSALFNQRIVSSQVRPIGLGILVIIMTSGIDSVASKLGSVHVGRGPASGEPILLDPGAVGVATAGRPAVWSCDSPKGQIKGAADGAGEAACASLGMTTPEDPGANYIVSAIGLVGAPVAAVIGSISASRSRLPQDKLAECEVGLAQAFISMSQQNLLRDCILEEAKATGGRRFVAWAASDVPARPRENHELRTPPVVGTILETRVEELRLARKGAGDSSFALRIKGRVRMLRSSSGEVISDEAFEYESGEGLFLDWALNNGEPFQKCTDTGYRRLAAKIVERIIETTGEAPIVIGAGAPKPSVHTPRAKVMLVSHGRAPALPPRAQFVSQPVAGPGTLYVYPVYPTSPAGRMSVQRPLTKDEAVSEALSDVNASGEAIFAYSDGVVSLAGIAVMIPVSLGAQIAAAIRGVSAKKFRAADAQMTTAAQNSRPAADLALKIAQGLDRHCAESVVLLDKTGEDGNQLAPVWFTTGKTMPVSWPGNGPTIFRAGDKVLKIEVVRAALKGDGSINPSLAVHLEARATLVRGDGGSEIYSCPVHYRGGARKFTAWAANDAKLFREELQRGYEKLSGTVIDQMMARRLIAPGEKPNVFLADNQE